jgi:hypothetical protein
MKCGERLFVEETLPKDLSFDEKLEKIQRYLPKGLTEKILSQREKIEDERKQVTVMFCDMEGFTVFSDVTEDTYKLTEGLFRFEGLGDREIKGNDNPIKVYRVLAPSTSRTRFDVSSEMGLAPFVGRERELELLLDGFERAKEGRGQAFSVVAEAGLGKSRLLYEFRKAIANENVTFLEGKCLSYNRNSSIGYVVYNSR